MESKLCKICSQVLSGRQKFLCSNCSKKKHEVVCVECNKSCFFIPSYIIRIDVKNHKCMQCSFKGEGNPNFGKKWKEEGRIKQSLLMKSRVDDVYRKNCSKGMKGKKVSDETKIKRKDTMLKKYGKLAIFKPTSQETKKKIGEKSKLKFTEEYKKRVRKVFEERGLWIPIPKKNQYLVYRDLSNWKYQVLTEHTVGIEKLKFGKLYNRNNRKKDALVRDHLYGRINGYENGVFPELIRHPANCQIITHSENIIKSKINNDSVISLEELLEKIKNWKLFYEEQEICLIFVKKYEEGLRFDINNYLNNIL